MKVDIHISSNDLCAFVVDVICFCDYFGWLIWLTAQHLLCLIRVVFMPAYRLININGSFWNFHCLGFHYGWLFTLLVNHAKCHAKNVSKVTVVVRTDGAYSACEIYFIISALILTKILRYYLSSKIKHVTFRFRCGRLNHMTI